jgi:hypothetical protein
VRICFSDLYVLNFLRRKTGEEKDKDKEWKMTKIKSYLGVPGRRWCLVPRVQSPQRRSKQCLSKAHTGDTSIKLGE